MFRRLAYSLFGLLGLAGAGLMAANIPYFTGPNDPSQMNAQFNQLIQTMNSSITPQTMANFQSPRNFLDNGEMIVNQRGTGIKTCGTTTAPASSISADRWQCNANVTSGAGRQQVITSTPSPPLGFVNSNILYRTSGALTQPVCTMQEIPTSRSVSIDNQTVVFSVQLQALAGLAADNGNVANLIIISGTVADEGLQSFTASPAITPAWTGIATLVNASVPITTTWATYNTGPVSIPAAAKEVGVMLCFTPTATGAGTTDGFAFTGAQLEALINGAVGPSVFEHQPYGQQLREAQRYYYQMTEPATAATPVAAGVSISTTECDLSIRFPATMRAAPTYANSLTNAMFGIISSTTVAALSTPFSATKGVNTIDLGGLAFTTGATQTAYDVCELVSVTSGTGVLAWTADF